MKINIEFITRARARIAFIAVAVFMTAAAWPGVSQAQTVVRVPPATIQVPARSVQVPPVSVPPVSVTVPDRLALDQLKLSLDLLSPAIDVIGMQADLTNLDLALADMQVPDRLPVLQTPRVTASRVFYGSDEASLYESGLSSLDSEQWQRAIERFDRVIQIGKNRVDGAMYWKAYALDKLGQRNDALTTLQALEKSYPNSRYLDDAKALAIEVRQSAGQPVRPEDQATEDLKLIALSSVMQADPERGIPLLEQIIKGHNSLKIKQRALFLLSTSDSPRARDGLVGIARGGANPDLQLKAIRYLGVRNRANGQLLGEIYGASKDPDVKREIIRSLMISRDVDQLLNIAKTEPSPELRIEAIRQLGTMRADNQLYQLYSLEKAGEIREQIFRSMMMSGSPERAAELAKQEADAKVRASAVRSLGTVDSAKTGDALVEIYRADKDQGVKKAVVNALYMQQNAKALVGLARQESDPIMKKEIVSRLSTMKSKEATDYMLELLK